MSSLTKHFSSQEVQIEQQVDISENNRMVEGAAQMLNHVDVT